MILADAILGLELFGTTWWIIAAIVAVIELIIVGISYSDSFSNEMENVIGSSFACLLLAAFWPLVVGITAVAVIVSAPLFIGKHIGKLWGERKKKQKRKEKFMNQIDKMKKIKE